VPFTSLSEESDINTREMLQECDDNQIFIFLLLLLLFIFYLHITPPPLSLPASHPLVSSER
jgi:hypothetical protein